MVKTLPKSKDSPTVVGYNFPLMLCIDPCRKLLLLLSRHSCPWMADFSFFRAEVYLGHRSFGRNGRGNILLFLASATPWTLSLYKTNLSANQVSSSSVYKKSETFLQQYCRILCRVKTWMLRQQSTQEYKFITTIRHQSILLTVFCVCSPYSVI